MADTTEAERNLLLSTGEEPVAPFYKFVFTGGPCGGKTTSLARVFSFLRERGYEVITIPETFTVLSSNGMSFDFFSTEGMAQIIQGTVLDIQLTMEDTVERVLRARGKPAVMLCDRGTMDGSVYLPSDQFDRILQERNTDIVQIRDSRYNGIFHLVTAADGAVSHYTLENNKVRHESPEQAIQADKKTQRAWVGSPHLYVLDNSTDFEGKMTRLVDIIAKIVGLPSNLKRRSAKFLLSAPPDLTQFPEDIDYHVFEVEKVYLLQQQKRRGTMDSVDFSSTVDPNSYSFIRRRTSVDATGRSLGSVYQLTRVKVEGDEVIEQKRIISQREYISSSRSRDPSRHVIKQRRISFLYAQQSFIVHQYVKPSSVEGLCILHAQVEASSSSTGQEFKEPEVKLPPFLSVDRMLLNTKEDEKQYGAYSVSLKQPPSE